MYLRGTLFVSLDGCGWVLIARHLHYAVLHRPVKHTDNDLTVSVCRFGSQAARVNLAGDELVYVCGCDLLKTVCFDVVELYPSIDFRLGGSFLGLACNSAAGDL